MTVTHDLSLVSLLANASVLVQAVMVLLLLMSIISWWFMFRKMFTLRVFKEQTHLNLKHSKKLGWCHDHSKIKQR